MDMASETRLGICCGAALVQLIPTWLLIPGLVCCPVSFLSSLNRWLERNTFKMSSTLPFFLPEALLEKQVRIVRYGLALAASLETKIPSKFILILS